MLLPHRKFIFPFLFVVIFAFNLVGCGQQLDYPAYANGVDSPLPPGELPTGDSNGTTEFSLAAPLQEAPPSEVVASSDPTETPSRPRPPQVRTFMNVAPGG